MIDFPTPTFIGQKFNSGTGPLYVWDGVAWSLDTSQTRTAKQKNLVINPSMQVSQENGSTAVGNNAYPVDQFQLAFNAGTWTAQQVTVGTQKRIRCICTVAKASLAAGDYAQMTHKIEGLRCVELQYGFAAALQTVLRFGFKGPAGTYSLRFIGGGGRSYVANFTISAAQANTDTIQTFTVPGDVTGTWVIDNTAGLEIGIAFAIGTTYQGTAGWQAGNILGTSANSNGAAVANNTFEIWDVGLYPDPLATGLPPEFIMPTYEDEQLRCKRYYQTGNYSLNGYMQASTSNCAIATPWGVSMRAAPTMSKITSSGLATICTDAFSSTAESFGFQLQTNGTGSGNAFSYGTYKANARM